MATVESMNWVQVGLCPSSNLAEDSPLTGTGRENGAIGEEAWWASNQYHPPKPANVASTTT